MATAIGRARSARAALISLLALTAMALSAGGVSAAPPSAFGVDPASLDFGSVTINTTSGVQTLTITAGRKDVVLDVMVNGGTFTVEGSGTCLTAGNLLVAGASCTIDMTYSPLLAHADSGTLMLKACMKWEPDGVTGLPHCTRVKDEVDVSLSGVGTDPLP